MATVQRPNLELRHAISEAGLSGEELARKVNDVGEEAGIRLGYGRLSKGLQQLTLIAGLLVRPPARLVVLDDPERHLDADARATLVTLVEEAREDGAAVLLATHSDELADRTCDSRVAIGDSAPAPHDGAGT
ncbi:ABC-type multidrug transport system ATPase subunit [Nocardiopsis mwathae]|uniref:ABC-type multidrug transport system ATPase subunit n=2 Tax=Nocardiopsis mwathae TaxID=1472723 RepID=A0A7W9YNA9_9ACTN|nr:ABC-type multidrug transport system ATPase subunit [Nocardiopsis mwathae]